MGRIRYRDALFAIAIALLAGVAGSSSMLEVLRGLSIDALTALRWRAAGHVHDPASSPSVVVALDEETYRTPPFVGTPNITWTRELAHVMTTVLDAGAKVVGFDMVFPTSIEQSEIPFGTETLGGRVRGFDRDFLRAIALAGRSGKLVLGEAQHGAQPILPSPGQRTAVGGQKNIRALNFYNDPDDVVRRVPLTFDIDGVATTSMAVELASRVLGVAPEIAADRTMTLAGYRIPARVPNTLALNFEGGQDIPTFSLADLRACAESGNTEYFRRYFDGKVVLIGTVLDVEDRHITSKRFATAPGAEGAQMPRCMPSTSFAGGNFVRDSISGVYGHATAVNNLIRHEALVEFGRLGSGVAGAAVAAFAALAALLLAPIAATLAYITLGVFWVAAAVVAFRHAMVLPLVDPLAVGFVALAVTIGYRFGVADKDKRFLRKSFALYLAPAVIERMMESEHAPELGGESRVITVYFSDVAGFSTFAEKMTPVQLVALMNEYLSAMTDIIEQHGGFVDKYIGDAIVAVFGAPLDDPDHAANAVRAALACRARLEELNHSATGFQGYRLGQRIGINSGEALVGNIGSHRRFNYTVMGDMVNLASRLEGANKYFATSIMASQETVDRAGPGFRWRELDSVQVAGRSQPINVHEPLAAAGQETPEQQALAAIYADGLGRWRACDFAAAARCFASVAKTDPPSALFLKRAEEFVRHPPGPDWRPVHLLEDK
jgi:class 3 adenylate cyclase/CHASE2 domain-containing sensor protein